MRGKHIATFCLAGALGVAAVSAFAGTILSTGDITQDVSGWSSSTNTGATILGLTNISDAERGLVLDLNYDLGSGEWVKIESPVIPSTLDLSSLGDALQFDLKGDGPENILKVELTDSGGHIYRSQTMTTRAADWTTVKLPLSSFIWAYGGNSGTAFAFGQVSKLAFTVEGGSLGSGSVTIDQVVATSASAATAAELLVDGCENVTLNDLNSTVGIQNEGTVNTVTAVTPIDGTYCFLITNPSAVQEGGIYSRLYRNNNTGQPISVTPYTHLSMYVQAPVYITGTVRVILTDLRGYPYENDVNIADYLPGNAIPTTGWARLLIPLGDLSGPNSIDLEDLGTLSFYLPASSSLYVDRVSFNSITFTTRPDTVIDAMDTYHNISSWKSDKADGTTLSFTTVAGRTGNAMRMNYSFSQVGTGQWVKGSRGFALNLYQDNSDAFQFEYRGTGSVNNLEFQVTDLNNTVFIIKLPKFTFTDNEWKTLTVPYKDMIYFSGSNQHFDLTQLTRVSFAITKSNGGAGTFDLHDIRYARKADYQETLPPGRLIEQFSIDNNPFAPQTDTVKNTATFTYTLTETAEVSLNIYDLAGTLLKRIEAGSQAAGEQALTWNGLDKNDRRVRNGLYLYLFAAKGQKTTQRIRNIIGVVR